MRGPTKCNRKVGEFLMKRKLLVLATALLGLGIVCARAQQYPMLDRVAGRVVQKYQTSSCAQLAAQRGARPTGQRAEEEERFVRLLHEDPQMRREFLNRVAAPIADKMFECNMIP
jgi:hypothetical protein